jgi:DNA-binding transcriptional LysR family regulator
LNKSASYAHNMFMNEQNSNITSWDEIRIAYYVAKSGTLSAASARLGVHHATLIRHIDALEKRLGCKLFQRNPRGYNPTEAGLELLKTGGKIEEQFLQMEANVKGRSDTISGELVVTALDGMSRQLTPLLMEFGELYPDVVIKFIGEERLLQLEQGEAHVALRVGGEPREQNNIAQKIGQLPGAFFAHKNYVARYGPLKGAKDAKNHRFVGRITPNDRIPFQKWMSDYVPDECITYQVSNMRSYQDAIEAGAGIGFMSVWGIVDNPDLVQMMPAKPEWNTPMWLVTHIDLHRTAKVNALAGFLKKRLKETFARCSEKCEVA